jgi:hypothetical protein
MDECIGGLQLDGSLGLDVDADEEAGTAHITHNRIITGQSTQSSDKNATDTRSVMQEILHTRTGKEHHQNEQHMSIIP